MEWWFKFNLMRMCCIFFSMTLTVARRVKQPAAKRNISSVAATIQSIANHRLITLHLCTIVLGPSREPCGTLSRPRPSRQICKQLDIWYVMTINNSVQSYPSISAYHLKLKRVSFANKKLKRI